MLLTPRTLLLIVAIFCFVAALTIATGTFHGNEVAWMDGGLVALATASLAPGVKPPPS